MPFKGSGQVKAIQGTVSTWTVSWKGRHRKHFSNDVMCAASPQQTGRVPGTEVQGCVPVSLRQALGRLELSWIIMIWRNTE